MFNLTKQGTHVMVLHADSDTAGATPVSALADQSVWHVGCWCDTHHRLGHRLRYFEKHATAFGWSGLLEPLQYCSSDVDLAVTHDTMRYPTVTRH